MKRLQLSSFKLTGGKVCYKSIYDRHMAYESTAAKANAPMFFNWVVEQTRALLHDTVKYCVKATQSLPNSLRKTNIFRSHEHVMYSTPCKLRKSSAGARISKTSRLQWPFSTCACYAMCVCT